MEFIFVLFAVLSIMLAGAFSIYASLNVMEEQFEVLYFRLRELEGDIAALRCSMSDEDKDD